MTRKLLETLSRKTVMGDTLARDFPEAPDGVQMQAMIKSLNRVIRKTTKTRGSFSARVDFSALAISQFHPAYADTLPPDCRFA